MMTTLNEHATHSAPCTILTNRRLLTCPQCGWVHYVMTAEEKTVNDKTLARLTARYQLTKEEQSLYESAYRQCLRCETPADEFQAASEQDIHRAESHMVTPVFVAPTVGSH